MLPKGVEVKAGQPLKVQPGEDKIIHLSQVRVIALVLYVFCELLYMASNSFTCAGSAWNAFLFFFQASLGESKNKGSESIPLFLKFGDQKLVLGTLSTENFPQLSFDLVFEKEFELSHNWKHGSVYFIGYKAITPEEYPFHLTFLFTEWCFDTSSNIGCVFQFFLSEDEY